MVAIGVRTTSLGIALLLGFAAGANVPAQAVAQELFLSGGKVEPMEGPSFEGGGIHLKGGKIAALGARLAAPKGATVVTLPKDAVVIPGLIDAACHLGLRRQRNETARPIVPELRVNDGLDPRDAGFAAALHEGITTLHIVPGEASVIAGRGVVVKPLTPSGLRVISNASLQRINFVEGAYSRDRAPTNLLGGLELFRSFTKDTALTALHVEGRPLLLSARTRREVQAALDETTGFTPKPILLGNQESSDLLPGIAHGASGFIFEPLLPSLEDRDRKMPAMLAKDGLPIAFASLAPEMPVSALRLSASVAHRGGLDAPTARKALTLFPAKLLGIASRVGSLTVGKDADLVVFSHDPLDPRASVLAVIQDGHLVHSNLPKDGP